MLAVMWLLLWLELHAEQAQWIRIVVVKSDLLTLHAKLYLVCIDI
jgi:hypothetical protein